MNRLYFSQTDGYTVSPLLNASRTTEYLVVTRDSKITVAVTWEILSQSIFLLNQNRTRSAYPSIHHFASVRNQLPNNILRLFYTVGTSLSFSAYHIDSRTPVPEFEDQGNNLFDFYEEGGQEILWIWCGMDVPLAPKNSKRTLHVDEVKAYLSQDSVPTMKLGRNELQGRYELLPYRQQYDASLARLTLAAASEFEVSLETNSISTNV